MINSIWAGSIINWGGELYRIECYKETNHDIFSYYTEEFVVKQLSTGRVATIDIDAREKLPFKMATPDEVVKWRLKGNQ